MAAPVTVFFAALAAIAFFSLLGAPLARWLAPRWAPAASVAPALGWGVFSAASFLLQTVTGFGRLATALIVIASMAGAILWLILMARKSARAAQPWPIWAIAMALAIAAIPMIGLLPKAADGGVIIGVTAFDHSKIAMVDEMTRLGLPVGNPFFGLNGARSSLPYYFLWHFVAAELSSLLGVTGWEADAAMTGVTAYTSLLLMMGLASRLADVGASGGSSSRSGSILWTGVLSLCGSLQPAMVLVLGRNVMDRLWAPYRELETWMAQASWVPQHLASACCAVLACLILWDLARDRRGYGVVVVVGALAASAFGASAWVGGVAFSVMALGVGVLGVLRARSNDRIRYVAAAIGAGGVAAVLAFPFLQAEFAALTVRREGSAIAFHPFEVIGPIVSNPLRRFLDLPAYWLLRLPIDLPAVYPAGLAALILFFQMRRGEKGSDEGPPLVAFAWITAAGLCISWLLASTIGNNDLGWRALLPAILVLLPLAAAGLSQWVKARAVVPVLLAAALIVASFPERMIKADIFGRSTENAPDFAEAPAFWAAVRRHAGPSDRVANNPAFLDDLTPWSVNPSWAMLSNRASCYSGWETARAYIALPAAEILNIDQRFIRVFDGSGTAEDVHRLATDYGCRVAAVIDSDGAWEKDPFAKSPDFTLVEANDHWRIYRSTAAPEAALKR